MRTRQVCAASATKGSMGAPHSVPALLLRTPVAQVISGGELRPANDAMRAWLADGVDHINRLPIPRERCADLLAGEDVEIDVNGRHWQLECVAHEDAQWLFVHDVSDRVAHATGELAAARCRALGSMAGSLVHDLNNHFNQMFALSSCLGSAVKDPSDQQMVADLEASMKLGTRMASSMARLLVQEPLRVAEVLLEDVLEDVLAVQRKDLELSGIDIHVESSEGVLVRVTQLTAVQAVMHGIAALQSASPQVMRCQVLSEPRSIAGGRPRPSAILRCEAQPMEAGIAEDLLVVVAGGEGSLARVGKGVEALSGVAAAAFAQRHAGGELMAERHQDGVRLDYVWPEGKR